MEPITSGVAGGEISKVGGIGVVPAPDTDLLTITYSLLSADALQAEVASAEECCACELNQSEVFYYAVFQTHWNYGGCSGSERFSPCSCCWPCAPKIGG